jgi:hypothetical protein
MVKPNLTALVSGAILGGALLANQANAQNVSTNVLVDANKTLTWNWTNQFLLTYSDPALGTITGSAPNWYDTNSLVNLTAAPDTPTQYQFANWSGVPSSLGAQTNNASISFNMNGPYTPVANFALRNFTLTVVSTFGGTNVGNPNPGTVTVPYGSNVLQTIQQYVTNAPGVRLRNTGANILP